MSGRFHASSANQRILAGLGVDILRGKFMTIFAMCSYWLRRFSLCCGSVFMFVPPLHMGRIKTNATASLPVIANHVQGMAIRTMSPYSTVAIVTTLSDRITHIVGLRSNENMLWIYAKRFIAFVTSLKRTIEIKAVEKVAHNTMNKAAFILKPSNGVTTVGSAAPDPAAFLIYGERMDMFHMSNYKGERPSRQRL